MDHYGAGVGTYLSAGSVSLRGQVSTVVSQSAVPFCPGVTVANGIVIASKSGDGCPTTFQTTVTGTYSIVYTISTSPPNEQGICGPYSIQASGDVNQYGPSRLVGSISGGGFGGGRGSELSCTGNTIFSMVDGASFGVYTGDINNSQDILYAEISITQVA